MLVNQTLWNKTETVQNFWKSYSMNTLNKEVVMMSNIFMVLKSDSVISYVHIL